ncbi:sulfur carrier protein ThiS adenylyltransferase ThiF [Proteinivorax hydrogeniformans]|uniref:Sulfur carrier protein ThiS adenylyltransferase ThiF n=1 Tax=Proteinivorax hydrogeniformans TaxID=1826727 RepID=A0AAU8HVH1_9FIRM
MKVYVNEQPLKISQEETAFGIRGKVKQDADVIVLNGFIIRADQKLRENDELIFIKKGEMPAKEDLEALLVARHTPGVHKKVKNAKIGIAGLGGLGSNIALSLARTGVGKLLLVDFDVVEPSNLNRQHYFVKHIGMYKTDALRDILTQINPFVEVETKRVYLDENNMADTFKDVDIVVEAFDNPTCKAELVNTVLTKLPQKPIVAASGMAGYFSSNLIDTKKVRKNLYLVGDGVNEAKEGSGLMAPRVAVAANHQANMVLRLILGEKEV